LLKKEEKGEGRVREEREEDDPHRVWKQMDAYAGGNNRGMHMQRHHMHMQ